MNISKVYEDLKVDLNGLDENAVNQAILYAEYSLLWVEAIKARDDLKRNLELLRSDLDEMIRAEPNKYGWEKDKAPTEAFVSQRIINDPDYIDLNDQLAKSQYEVNVTAVIKESFDKRGHSINVLKDLYIGNYFSTTSPRLSHTMTKQAQEAQNEMLKENVRLKRRTE